MPANLLLQWIKKKINKLNKDSLPAEQDLVSREKPMPEAILKTGDFFMFNKRLSMTERMDNAIFAWESDDRGWQYLLTKEAFFAAQCWVYTHKIYDQTSDAYDERITSYVKQSRKAMGGDGAWDTLLSQRAACSDCGETWKKENISYCVACMNYVCYRCGAQHVKLCGEKLVG